ncbi:type II toxin-antitoxin system prevent-host-death family antitoxin [Nocardiopsis halophila]|uniref:type II toxin-antitoxin system prevent-host-death family antitoxin n=1 Tax=Nocardiopsis halophila TaxID=141692 RepID=UPI00034BB9D6|nr:type II toxin-antitoxin system prevent-host-death family antitoxin [Nocardiopsis halophila]
MDNRISIREFRAGLAEIVSAAVNDEQVTVVTRDGEPVGAFVPMFMREKLEDREDQRLGERAMRVLADDHGPGSTISQVMADIMDEHRPGGSY